MKLQEILLLSPEQAIRHILGSTIFSNVGGVMTGGMITELEAYLANNDAAAHGSRGETKANASLYKAPGTMYLHSMHRWLLMDIVTQENGIPSSMLVRAIVPTTGILHMKERRSESDMTKLCNGPGKVCQALGLTKEMDGQNILAAESPVWIELANHPQDALRIAQTKRIGLTKNAIAPLRFVLER